MGNRADIRHRRFGAGERGNDRRSVAEMAAYRGLCARIYIRVKLNHIGERRRRGSGHAHMHKEPILCCARVLSPVLQH